MSGLTTVGPRKLSSSRSRLRSWLALSTRPPCDLEPVRLGPGAFALAWLALGAVQAVVMLYLVVFTVAYVLLSGITLVNVRRTLGFPGPGLLRLAGLVNVLMFGVYVYNFGRTLAATCRRRRLAFARPPGPQHATTRSDVSYLTRLIGALRRALLGRRGLFGIANPYFDELLLLREAIEILSQAYQSYIISTCVSRPWLNGLATGLLVLNCWSSPIVHGLFPRYSAQQRVCALALDVALDFAWGVLIPTVLVFAYLLQYDRRVRAFPDRLNADTAWALRWEMEARLLLVTSITDLVTSLVPLLSIAMTCRSISNTLTRDSTSQATTKTSVVWTTRSRQSIQPLRPTLVVPVAGGGTKRSKRFTPPPPSTFERIGRRIMLVLGAIVIVTQVYAALGSRGIEATICRAPLTPWFADRSRYSCALAEIDCCAIAKTSPESLRQEMTMRLQVFNPTYLSYVVFTHCEDLVIPTILRNLSSLTGLEIYNSTIADWPDEAALGASSHPILRRVGIVRSNWSASNFPQGLAPPDLPASLLVINLVGTNLTDLPMFLGTRWQHVEFLNLENGVLEVFPPVIRTWRQLNRLSLINNRLTAIPDLDDDMALGLLAVDGNPLGRLPERIGDLSQLSWVSFANTNVSSLPWWLQRIPQALPHTAVVYADGSAYCIKDKDANAPPIVDCTSPNPRVGGLYPLEAEIARRQALLS